MRTTEGSSQSVIQPGKAAIPPHVPLDRVVDFDMYNPPGITDGLQKAWARLQAPGIPDLVWTPANEGHWIATRGKLIRASFENYEAFSAEFYSIHDRPYTVAKILKWSGISLAVIGVIGLYAANQSR